MNNSFVHDTVKLSLNTHNRSLIYSKHPVIHLFSTDDRTKTARICWDKYKESNRHLINEAVRYRISWNGGSKWVAFA